MSLSILCVSKAEPFALPFLSSMVHLGEAVDADVVFAADGWPAYQILKDLRSTKVIKVESRGYVESVLNTALEHCDGDYILRLDDDEKASPSMVEWLKNREFESEPHWKFPRAHLWRDTSMFIAAAPLWPDHQTRLSVQSMAGGRTTVHAGSPFGGGEEALVVLEHHKFLVKSTQERRTIAERYDRVHPGYGTGGMLAFNLPEQVWPNEGDIRLRPIGYADWCVTMKEPAV